MNPGRNWWPIPVLCGPRAQCTLPTAWAGLGPTHMSHQQHRSWHSQEPVTRLTPGDIKPMLGQVITNINTKMAGLDMDNQVILPHFIRKAIDRSILTSLHVINHGHRTGIIFKSRNENAAWINFNSFRHWCSGQKQKCLHSSNWIPMFFARCQDYCVGRKSLDV